MPATAKATQLQSLTIRPLLQIIKLMRGIAFRTPIYEFQLIPTHGLLRDHLIEYEEIFFNWPDKHKKKLDKLQADLVQLQQQAAQGTAIHLTQWESKQKELGEINLEKSNKELGEKRMAYTIELSIQKFFSFFGDIQDDYETKYINKVEYVKFLKLYQEVITTGKSLQLNCFKEIPSPISNAIEKYL